MGKGCWAFAAFLLSVGSASGQYITAKLTCSRDVTEFCSAARSEGNRFAECAKAHFLEFGEPCKTALVKIAAVREACQADIREQCHAIKPGAGRLLLCVKKHFSALSEPCRDAIGQATAKAVAR